MSKQKDKEGTEAAGPKTGPKTGPETHGRIPQPPAARFEIRVANGGFRGKREGRGADGVRWSLSFNDGVAWTSSEEAAAACRSWGYGVIDYAAKTPDSKQD